MPVVGWGGSRRHAAAMNDDDGDSDDDDDDDIDVGDEASWSSDRPASKPTSLITPRQFTPYALSRSSPESPALQPSDRASAESPPSYTSSSAAEDTFPNQSQQSQRAPLARRRPPRDDYPYGDAGDHPRDSKDGQYELNLELESASAASVPWLNLQKPPRHASSSSFSSTNTTSPLSSSFSESTTAAAAESSSRPQTRDKPPPDTRTAREALAARLAQGSPMRKSSSGSMPGLSSPHQRQPPPPSRQQHAPSRQPSRQRDNRYKLDEGFGEASRSGSEEDEDHSVGSHSRNGDSRKEASGAPTSASAPIFQSRPPPGDDYYHDQHESSRGTPSANSHGGEDGGRISHGDSGSSGTRSDSNALKQSEEGSGRGVAAQPSDAPTLPALGVQFFRELLTPRLSTDELSRRVRCNDKCFSCCERMLRASSDA